MALKIEPLPWEDRANEELIKLRHENMMLQTQLITMTNKYKEAQDQAIKNGDRVWELHKRLMEEMERSE